jgi:hypothetical protein
MGDAAAPLQLLRRRAARPPLAELRASWSLYGRPPALLLTLRLRSNGCDPSLGLRRAMEAPTAAPSRMDGLIWRHIPASRDLRSRPTYNAAEAWRLSLGARAPVVLS